ncbi:MAG: hypothetical protein NTX50_14035 [Candidatus Sumerlaeota bacterium]|nr:hypothetical protein [Candidatus Sumerlaeota bacterium]
MAKKKAIGNIAGKSLAQASRKHTAGKTTISRLQERAARISMASEYWHAAEQLASMHAKSTPSVKEILFFPDKEERVIRFLEVKTDTLGNRDRIRPLYLAALPRSKFQYDCELALILPKEKRRLAVPDGWGNWDNAIRIYQRKTHSI